MLNGRLYRAAMLPVLLALGIAAFSLGTRPAPQTTTLAPDAFEGERALAETRSLAARYPDRRPGSTGDEELAAHVAATIEGLGSTTHGGFQVTVRRSQGQTVEGQRELATVIAQRPGSTGASPILIVAHRDAAEHGSAAEMSATATLLELARVFAARETKRTIVLVSTSGGSGGDGGAEGLLESLEGTGLHGPFDAAVVLGDMAGRSMRSPIVVPYSDGLGAAPLQLQRTVAAAIVAESGWNPGEPTVLGQLAHLTFPIALGEQGVLNAQGLPAVLVQASGEHSPGAREALSGARLEGLGRGVLNAVDALDTAPDVPAALQTGVVLQHKVVPEWALRLLLGTLLIAPLIVAADGLARVRRRRRPVGRWTLWTLSCALPFLCGAVLCWLMGEIGIIGAAPSVPVPAGALSLDASAVAAVTAAVLTVLLAWALRGGLLRRAGLEVAPDPEVAGLAILLVLIGLTIVVWVGNPYTALLLVPAVHLWLLLASPELRPRRPLAVAIVLVGLAPFALLLSFYARQLGLGPGKLAWSAVLAVAGGHIGLGSALLWSIGFGCAAGAARLAVASPPDPLDEMAPQGVRVSIRGPLSYAGPGSLGGTESALRR
jgi:hypothetical protein